MLCKYKTKVPYGVWQTHTNELDLLLKQEKQIWNDRHFFTLFKNLSTSISNIKHYYSEMDHNLLEIRSFTGSEFLMFVIVYPDLVSLQVPAVTFIRAGFKSVSFLDPLIFHSRQRG